jgi:hypothetical protein
MYADPIHIRKHRVTIRLNDLEAELIEAINNFRGTQKGTILREILLSGVHRALQGDVDIRTDGQEMEGAQMALFGQR